jgi:DNA mismatch repair protein MutS2
LIQSETLNLLEWSRLCQHLSTFAVTKLGAVAARNLKIPANRAESLQLLAQTSEICELETQLMSSLSFDGIRDIGDSLERAERQGMLSGEELLAIATTLGGVRQLRRTIDACEDLPVLNGLVADARTYPDLEQEIHRCLDERGKVADRASPKLNGIRDRQRQIRDRVYQILQRIMQRQGNAVQQQTITQRSDRFVIPVKAPQKDAIPGIVHDTSTTGATLYVEPHGAVDLNNQARQLRRQEEEEENIVLRALTALVTERLEDLERLLAIATTLDLATARARYSQWLQANPPRFVEDRQPTLTLRQVRHPLLVWQFQHEQGREVVPVDILIRPPQRVVTITGPNTGGKTVILKTLGLAVLMAKVGLFVPAREPVELPWIEQVLADIGDEQSLQQNLSTFSGHVRRITQILEALGSPATEEEKSSLVLLDEVGAGTDPSEGSALAIALLQALCDRAQLTVATTHFGELKALKYQDDRFENAAVEFDEVSLSPTYRLLWGIPGRSNALTVAQRLGLDADIIDRAEQLVGVGANTDVNRMISGLEEQRRTQETKAQEASQIVEQAERLNREITERAEALQQREQRLRQEQERQVQAAIDEAKAEIAKVIRRLQQGEPTGEDARSATAAIDRIGKQSLPSKQQPPPKPKPGFHPQAGDRVRIPRLGQTAEVLSPPDKDGELSVRFGMMKMTVPLSDIESLSGEKPEVETKPKPAPAPSPAPAPPKNAPAVRTEKNTLDIRGRRAADAEPEVEAAIARAVPSGSPVWIIHGKGTGRLRQAVGDILQRHPQVSHYELASQKEGGSGVTIAYIG